MILPYLTIALLTFVTLYSAVVSFRQKPGGRVPGWIFPDGAKRPTRIFVGLATLVLIVGLAAFVSTSARNPTQRSFRFLIPESYTGWVRIEFEIPGASPLPVEAGQTVLKIPPDGLLRTSSPEQFGWAKDYYYFYSNSGLRLLPDSGAGRLIWGKINGETAGVPGKRTYEEFFVGTEQQYMQQAGEKKSQDGR